MVFMIKDWRMILEDYGFSRIDNVPNMHNVTAMGCGNIRIDMISSVFFTARIKVGLICNGDVLAGSQGTTENEAFSNLLKCTVCNGGATIADIIGIRTEKP